MDLMDEIAYTAARHRWDLTPDVLVQQVDPRFIRTGIRVYLPPDDPLPFTREPKITRLTRILRWLLRKEPLPLPEPTAPSELIPLDSRFQYTLDGETRRMAIGYSPLIDVLFWANSPVGPSEFGPTDR